MITRDAIGRFHHIHGENRADGASTLRARLERIREENKENIAKLTAIIEVGGASFLLGMLHGRRGGMPQTFGVPWDLAAAAALHLLAFSGQAKGYEDHLHNLGNGALAYYTGSIGAQIGQRMRKDSPDWKGAAMTEEEAKKAGLQVRTIVAGHNGAPAMGPGAPRHSWTPEQLRAMYGRAA